MGKANLKKYHPFNPRIINPVKIRRVFILSTDENMRKTGKGLWSRMPWIKCTILSNPMAVSEISGDEPFVLIMDDASAHFVPLDNLRKKCKQAVLILLTYNRIMQCSPAAFIARDYPYTKAMELVFAVDNDHFLPKKIIPAAVRAAEDALNIRRYARLKRYIFLVVDDEPRWISQFLPILYEIIGQRADVKITRTYEESLHFLFGVDCEEDIGPDYLERGYGDDVVCLISDIFFPQQGNLTSESGKKLINLVKHYYPRIPIIIASKTKEADALQEKGYILPKGNPGSLDTLKNYIHDFCGLGDFLVHDENHKVLYRLRNIREILEMLYEVRVNREQYEHVIRILNEYSEKDYFSTWLYMHSYRDLGERLRSLNVRGEEMITILIHHLEYELQQLSKRPLVINNYPIFNLKDLLMVLKSYPPSEIQSRSDNDVLSSWLDHNCHHELAELLRPIHGKGKSLVKRLIRKVEKHIDLRHQHNIEEV